MQGEPIWLETDYFESFRCKCGECRSSCCNGWDIAVTRDEYFRLIGLDCSEKLHHRLECAFRMPKDVSPQHFRTISPNWLGQCAMLDEDGLCMLQKECGEQALPEVCRVYPRSLRRENNHLLASCSCGCEAVTERLMEQNRLGFRFGHMHAKPEISESMDEEILGTGYECIMAFQDRETPLQKRVYDVCSRVGGEIAGAPPALSEGLRSLLNILDELPAPSIAPYCAGMAEKYACPEAYLQDVHAFELRFPEWQRWFENVLSNHLLYMVFPHVDARISVPAAAKGFAACWALLRALCAHHAASRPTRQDMADVISAALRMVEHSPFYFNCSILVQDWRALAGL